MTAAVIGLHVIGWGALLAIVVPHHYSIGTQTFGVGIGLTAYTLGARHAFDADHISAIDNTTRKLMADGKRPLSVGFWFSLGHSSVVFALSLLLAIGIKAIVGPVKNGGSGLHQVTNLIGTSVSGFFLYVIAAINIAVLLGILKVFKELKQGRFDQSELEQHLNARGFVMRFFKKLPGSIRTWPAAASSSPCGSAAPGGMATRSTLSPGCRPRARSARTSRLQLAFNWPKVRSP